MPEEKHGMSLGEFARELELMYNKGVFNNWDETEGTLDPQGELEIVCALSHLQLAYLTLKKADLLQTRGRAQSQMKGII